MEKVMEKVIFKQGYFEDINKVQYIRKPMDSAGFFEDVIIIHYTKWYKLREKISFSNKAEADKLMKFLGDKLSQEVTLRDVILKD